MSVTATLVNFAKGSSVLGFGLRKTIPPVLKLRPLEKSRKCRTAALGCSFKRAGEGDCSSFFQFLVGCYAAIFSSGL
jgi:hypothetical protein